ncbi:MAG: hypothetical protein ABR518_00305, partial [Actinomycetota bacterium]
MTRRPTNRIAGAFSTGVMLMAVLSLGVGLSSAQVDQPAAETATAFATVADAAVISTRPSANLGGRGSLLAAT